MRKAILLLLALMALISGCAREIAETAPEQAVIEPQEAAPATEIIAKGRQGMEMIISPSVGKVIKGSVLINVNNAPEGTRHMLFSLRGQGITDDGPNIGIDGAGSDGWSVEFDTSRYGNGQYQIFAWAFSQAPGPEVQETATAWADTVIENAAKKAQEEPQFIRRYPDIIKGVWEPSDYYVSKALGEDVERLKSLGVNTISIVPGYKFNNDGSYYTEEELEQSIANVKKAKEKGFAVLIAPEFIGGMVQQFDEEGIDVDLNKYKKASEEVALYWAGVAEKYKVEFFAPQNEFNTMITENFAKEEAEIARLTTEWHREVLPKVKGVYSGKLLAKLNFPHRGIDATGYDYVGITIAHVDEGLDNFRRDMAYQFEQLEKIAAQSNAKWLISEAWMIYGGEYHPELYNKEGQSLDELQDDYFRISFEEYQKHDTPAGYIFAPWLMPGAGVKGRPAEQAMKGFFEGL